MEYIYLKVVRGEESAYTTLSALLRSESLERIYHPVNRLMAKGEKFIFNQITISKVKLNHFKRHGKTGNGNHRRPVGDSNGSPVKG